MFVIQSEDKRGYSRLNKKYMGLFNQAYDDYVNYKKKQLKNFKSQTKAIVDICRDIDSVKSVIKDFKDQFEEYEQSEFEKIQTLKDEIKEKNKDFSDLITGLEDQNKTN
mmetsp:Transcript_1290/g.1592  ORF Transcript_1290/g.1592 Transcript_1290/m.1592 type:complete len:109 (-) Transcript_1290:4062-4388(-)